MSNPAGDAARPTVLLLSTSDTDLITARASGANYRWANPARLLVEDLPELLDGVDLVVIRILGGHRAWQAGIDAVRATGLPTVVVSGEQSPDAELMAHSTVPAGIAVQAHVYLAQGGVGNLANLYNFLTDTVLMTGHGFAEPAALPSWGELARTPADPDGSGVTVAVLYYRAQQLAGNTGYVEALCRAIEAAGARALPLYCASLRTAEPELLEVLGRADAMVVTVLAAGGARPATASAGGDDDSWNVEHLAALDIPILQGLCLTTDRAAWSGNDDGMSPLDVASQVAVPEFDGRIITVPFSFKEIDDDGLISYVADPERCARVAGLAVRHARLRHIPAAEKQIALVFSAYPTKHARIGNAVGLDTPASAIRLLSAMRDAGYDIGSPENPGDLATIVEAGDGDALMHTLIARGGQDQAWLTEEQLAANPIRVPAAAYQDWFATLPADFAQQIVGHWGPPPGEMFVDRSRDPDGEIVIAAIRSGNVVVMVQPPRGFGENPVAIYHDPGLPPENWRMSHPARVGDSNTEDDRQPATAADDPPGRPAHAQRGELGERGGGGHARKPRRRSQASRTTACALPSTVTSCDLATMSTRTVPSSFLAPTTAVISTTAPLSSSGTTTGRVMRTPYSTTAPGSPTQSVTMRPAEAIVSMPWAMTSGSPTALANRSFQWIGLKSPEAPAYMIRFTRCSGTDSGGSSVPTSTSSKAMRAVMRTPRRCLGRR